MSFPKHTANAMKTHFFFLFTKCTRNKNVILAAHSRIKQRTCSFSKVPWITKKIKVSWTSFRYDLGDLKPIQSHFMLQRFVLKGLYQGAFACGLGFFYWQTSWGHPASLGNTIEKDIVAINRSSIVQSTWKSISGHEQGTQSISGHQGEAWARSTAQPRPQTLGLHP